MANIYNVTANVLEGWRGKLMVLNEKITKPALKVEFCYCWNDSPYWKVQVRDESLFRSTYGIDVPYKCVTNQHQNLHPNAGANSWVMLIKNQGSFEVPKGCFCQSPTVFLVCMDRYA